MQGQRERKLTKVARTCNISIPEELKYGVVRGIYQFYVQKENSDKHCFYVGRAVDISKRVYEHIATPGDIVFELIQQYQKEGNTIIVEIELLPYKGDNYYRDMQRLAYAELECIERHQKFGDCLNQLPEGRWISITKWKEQI